jgi:endoglucanase
LAARVYEPYDKQLSDKWLAQAKLSYQFLNDNPNYVKHDTTLTQTGKYEENDTLPSHVDNDLDGNKRLWAAAELWETTGEPQYLADFEARANAADMHNYVVWQDLRSMALVTYLRSERPGKSPALVKSLETELVKAADNYVNNVNSHGYARVFGAAANTYHWGNNGSLAAITYILNTAYWFTGEKKYRDAGHEVIGHLLGRNYFGRSFVTGIGYNPPENVHCRRSLSPGNTQWPGYMVGGPNTEAYQPYTAMGGGTIPQGATCDVNGTRAPGVCYFDYSGDYARNEIAINWNASMVYALSGFLAEVEPAEPPVGVISRSAVVKPAGKSVKITRMISVRNGRSSAVIPPGAKVYSLDGRLVAHRKAGDAKAPAIRRNGVFIMKADGK